MIVVLLNILLWLVAVGFGILALYSLLNRLAQKNIFLTIVEEGTAKAITFFGKFQRAIMEFKDYKLDEEWNVIPLQPGETPEKKPLGGLRGVGIWPFFKIHEYKFQWATPRLASGEDVSVDSPERILQRDERIDYVFVKKDIYVIQLRSAEAKGMIPLDVVVVLTACACNIYKALFKTHNWMNIVIQSFEPVMRQLVAERAYEQIVAEKEMLQGQFCRELGFPDQPDQEPTGIIGRIKKEFGIEISNVGLKDINPAAEKRAEIINWATQQYQAEKRRDATRVDADATRIKRETEAIGEATAKRTLADADAYALDKVAEGRAKAVERVATAMGGKKKYAPDVVYLDTWKDVGTGDGKTIIATGLEGVKEDVKAFFKDKGAKK